MDRVLIVDDEKGMRDFLSILLKKEGYAVAQSESADRAAEQIGKGEFDLIISDISMPGKTGPGRRVACGGHAVRGCTWHQRPASSTCSSTCGIHWPCTQACSAHSTWAVAGAGNPGWPPLTRAAIAGPC